MSTAGHTYEQLETAFRHRNFKPLYFLFGEEQFLLSELQTLLVQHALQPFEQAFNLDIVYGAEADAADVLARCAAYPMMAERRVVIVRDFEKMRQNTLFTGYASRPNPSAVVLLSCGTKPNLSAHPYRALKEHAVWAELKPLYERQMPGWIQARVESLGRRIRPDALQVLTDWCGTNLRTAAGEIEKLVTYIGDRTLIQREDVLDVAGQAREFNVFELQKAIGEARYATALRITERMLQQASNRRGEALMVVSLLSGYFTKLWKLTVCQARNLPDKAIAARIGVSPYFLKEYMFSLQHYTPAAIERAFAALLAADYELKGGSPREDGLILTLMLRRIMGAETAPAHVRGRQ